MSDPHTEECVYCGGQGRVDVSDPGPEIQRVRWETCEACGGLGHVGNFRDFGRMLEPPIPAELFDHCTDNPWPEGALAHLLAHFHKEAQ